MLSQELHASYKRWTCAPMGFISRGLSFPYYKNCYVGIQKGLMNNQAFLFYTVLPIF